MRWKARLYLLGEDANSPEMRNLQDEIRSSERTLKLLSERQAGGGIPLHPYQKWRGAHWVLSMLADLGYPPGDRSLLPLFDQVYGWLLSKQHLQSVKTINNRARRCASQEGNALYAALALGLADERSAELANRLLRWQWPDGGWNCDKNPSADTSSFHETLIPLRALALYGRLAGNTQALAAARQAAEVFLSRNLFKRRSDDSLIDPNFLRLHYPRYWHYDTLGGLKAMAEAGFLLDGRCRKALDILEGKYLPDEGFPAEGKYYRVTSKLISGTSRVDWGPVKPKFANAFVTVEALGLLKAAGRLDTGMLH